MIFTGFCSQRRPLFRWPRRPRPRGPWRFRPCGLTSSWNPCEQPFFREYLPLCRWFGQKQRTLRSIVILETRAEQRSDAMRVMLLKLNFTEGNPVTQVLPLFIGKEDEGEPKGVPAVVAKFSDGMVLWDALYVGTCRKKVWEVLACREAWQGVDVRLYGAKNDRSGEARPTKTRLLGGEQSNSTLSFDDAYLLKFLRKFEPGPHPDADIIRALGNRNFAHVPRYAGEIRCRIGREEGVLALLTTYVTNQGECWTYALDGIARFFERVLSAAVQPDAEVHLVELAGAVFPPRMRQLGQRTGEMHCCLETIEGADFEPESFTLLQQRSLYQTMRGLLRRTEREVTNKLSSLAPEIRQQALDWFSRGPRILDAVLDPAQTQDHRNQDTRARRLSPRPGAEHRQRFRHSGILKASREEPSGERLLKRSPLVDVAGMLRSFDYGLEVSLLQQKAEDQDRLKPWALKWLGSYPTLFSTGIGQRRRAHPFCLRQTGEFDTLLKIFLLDKAVYEIGYELNYRPDFLQIPLSAVNRMVDGDEPAGTTKAG